MKLVQHPNVVRLYEVIDTPNRLFLVLELGDYDMYEFISKHDRVRLPSSLESSRGVPSPSHSSISVKSSKR